MPNDFGYPGIPTSRQNTSKTRFDNDNLSQRPKFSVKVERPSLEALYEDEPSTAELLAQAQGTLDDTAPMANQLQGAGLLVSNPADDVAAAEQGRTERQATREYRNAALSPLMASSFVPGPIGAASQLALGGAGMLDATDEDLSGSERAMGAGFGALAAIPAMRALRGVDDIARGPVPKTSADIGARVSVPRRPETPYRYSGELPASTTPDLPRYQLKREVKGLLGPGARQMGRDPDSYILAETGESVIPGAVPLESLSGKGKPSITALADDSVDASGRGSVDLTGALDDLGEAPLSPEAVNRARASERFGRNFRSESIAEPPQNVVQFPKTRGLSEGEERGVQELDDILNRIHGEDYDPAQVFPGKGGTYQEPPLPAPPPSVAPLDAAPEDGRAALQRIIDALFGQSPSPSVSRLTAQQALEEGDELGKRSVLFGGATSSDEGTFGRFVRPKERTPISYGPKRRGEGDGAISWNQP